MFYTFPLRALYALQAVGISEEPQSAGTGERFFFQDRGECEPLGASTDVGYPLGTREGTWRGLISIRQNDLRLFWLTQPQVSDHDTFSRDRSDASRWVAMLSYQYLPLFNRGVVSHTSLRRLSAPPSFLVQTWD